MPTIQIPNNWQPRPYQMNFWEAWVEKEKKKVVEIAHRRWGKDEICLHGTAVHAHKRPATYWHMLPLANQARKAIWKAINPHTGKRRIDEAFPHAVRSGTNEQEMMITFKSGSTWQVLGSDNFDSLVGSPPAGVVFSEFALANPAAWAYIRPIMAENNGWACFITTPRGNNHAKALFDSAINSPTWFAERQTVEDTGIFTPEKLLEERQELIDLFGEDAGDAYFRQEYYCSFDAAILGAYYGQILERMEDSGRITDVPYDPDYPVHTAWDIGYSDDTVIIFFQVVGKEVRIIDIYIYHGQDVDYYCDVMEAKPYNYGIHWLPHDAKAKTMAARGKSIQMQMADRVGWDHLRIVPNLSQADGIQATRKMLRNTWIDSVNCETGLEAWKQYRRQWNTEKRMFEDLEFKDWTNHPADALRMLAVAWQEEMPVHHIEVPRFPIHAAGQGMSVDLQQIFKDHIHSKRRNEYD